MEMNKEWNTRTKMIPIEIGALGTDSLALLRVKKHRIDNIKQLVVLLGLVHRGKSCPSQPSGSRQMA